MEKLKNGWQRTPSAVRRPVIMVIGMLFVIAAGLTGWLPGPGGIPLFLIGIAILATEFEWAQRLRDWVLGLVKSFGVWYRSHRIIGTLFLVACTAAALTIGVTFYSIIR